MSRKEELKISKQFADLIAESCERAGAEPIFGLIEQIANFSPEQIMIESRKDGVPLTLDQAKECSRQTRAIINTLLVDD